MPQQIDSTNCFERAPEERAGAFAAFLVYRDLGPQRSIDKAWRKAKNIDNECQRAARHWFSWSSNYNWEQRARAWDEHCERLARQAEEARRKELGARRAELDFKFQGILEDRIPRIVKTLEKLEAMPPTDLVREEKKDGSVVTRVKGLNASGYARLNKELRDTGTQAIVGVGPAEQQAPPELPELVVTISTDEADHSNQP